MRLFKRRLRGNNQKIDVIGVELVDEPQQDQQTVESKCIEREEKPAAIPSYTPHIQPVNCDLHSVDCAPCDEYGNCDGSDQMWKLVSKADEVVEEIVDHDVFQEWYSDLPAKYKVKVNKYQSYDYVNENYTPQVVKDGLAQGIKIERQRQ